MTVYQYDYIITGVGASGLILAYRMANDPFFDDKSILIIDKEKKSNNDRTWCYWEIGEGEWDDLLAKSWSQLEFKSNPHSEISNIAPYSYKMLRSSSLYTTLWEVIDQKENITFLEDEVLNISHKLDNASVLTAKSEYHGEKLINTIQFNKGYRQQNKFPVLRQHFLGWFIETEEDVFDDKMATFMDFTVPQRRSTRFMYILPLSSKKALVEYTIFSKTLLAEKDYEHELQTYLKKKGIQKYTVLEKEYGVIPMTAYKFWKHNSSNVLNIGTVGGWSKASTGYTFGNITRKTKDLVEFMKTGESFRKFRKSSRFWWYDLLLLDVLNKYNDQGANLFATLFKKNKTKKILKFLDDKTSFLQDISIMMAMPTFRFMRALFSRVFYKRSF